MKPIYWASRARISVACISVTCAQAIAAGPDPADATAATPPTTYRSPFADYRAYGDDKSTPWKDANDTVGKIGGWRAYAREAADAMKARQAMDAKTGNPAKPAPTTDTMPKSAPPVAVPQPHKHGG